jgi:hypothetical protein
MESTSLTVAVFAIGNCTASCQQETNAMLLSRDTSHHLFTLWIIILIEKPTRSQLVKEFTAFYGARRFNTACTRVHHLSLCRAGSVQSMPTHPYAWVLQVVSFPHVSPPNPVYTYPLSKRATYPVHLILLDLMTQTILGEVYSSLQLCSFLQSIVTSSLLGPNTIQRLAY